MTSQFGFLQHFWKKEGGTCNSCEDADNPNKKNYPKIEIAATPLLLMVEGFSYWQHISLREMAPLFCHVTRSWTSCMLQAIQVSDFPILMQQFKCPTFLTLMMHIVREISSASHAPHSAQQWKNYGQSCIQPAHTYFLSYYHEQHQSEHLRQFDYSALQRNGILTLMKQP